MGLGHYEVITDMVKHSTKFHKLEVGGEADHGLVQFQWHGKHQEDGATHVILCVCSRIDRCRAITEVWQKILVYTTLVNEWFSGIWGKCVLTHSQGVSGISTISPKTKGGG